MLTVVALLAPTIAHAEVEPRTWVGVDEYLGGFRAGDPWMEWGLGLSLRRRVLRHLELGVEGELLRLDDQRDHSLGHGFAARIAAEVGVPLTLGVTQRIIEWLAIPEVGAGAMAITGTGPEHRADDELFVGLRLAMRTTGFAAHQLQGRAFGGHIEMTTARYDGGYGGSFVIGFDWGW